MVWACVVKRRWWLGEKCTEHEVEGPRPRGRPQRTWREVVVKDCQARKLKKEDAIDHSRWRKLIKFVLWSGWVWVGECFLWYRPTWVVPDKRPLNGCVCVCMCCFNGHFLHDRRMPFLSSNENYHKTEGNRFHCCFTFLTCLKKQIKAAGNWPLQGWRTEDLELQCCRWQQWQSSRQSRDDHHHSRAD